MEDIPSVWRAEKVEEEDEEVLFFPITMTKKKSDRWLCPTVYITNVVGGLLASENKLLAMPTKFDLI